jgi:hypothetical protein
MDIPACSLVRLSPVPCATTRGLRLRAQHVHRGQWAREPGHWAVNGIVNALLGCLNTPGRPWCPWLRLHHFASSGIRQCLWLWRCLSLGEICDLLRVCLHVSTGCSSRTAAGEWDIGHILSGANQTCVITETAHTTREQGINRFRSKGNKNKNKWARR